MVAKLCVAVLCLAVAFLGSCTNVTQGATCIPGASAECYCPTGQQGAQTCTSAGTLAACVCSAPPADAGGGDSDAASASVLPAVCVPGISVDCACSNGQHGAQICISAGTFGPCVCSAPTMDAASAIVGGDAATSGGDSATTSPPDAPTAAGGSGGSVITGGVEATGGSGLGGSGGTVGSDAGVAEAAGRGSDGGIGGASTSSSTGGSSGTGPVAAWPPTGFVNVTSVTHGAYALGPEVTSPADAGAAGGSSGTPGVATNCTALYGLIRDFKMGNKTGGHPDFETAPTGIETGIVATTLGADNKPVYVCWQSLATRLPCLAN
jgi:hypothetical protein